MQDVCDLSDTRGLESSCAASVNASIWANWQIASYRVASALLFTTVVDRLILTVTRLTYIHSPVRLIVVVLIGVATVSTHT